MFFCAVWLFVLCINVKIINFVACKTHDNKSKTLIIKQNMNVVRENLADQTALLRITVSEVDYAEKVEKELKNYKRKASVPGFRPGMVPMSVVNKMYRKSTMADTTYRAATDAAFEYIKENDIEPLGDLMPGDDQKQLDFDNQKEFEFVFQIGLAPKVDLALTKKDVVERVKVTPNKEMIDGYRSNFVRRFGKLDDVDVIKKEEAVNVDIKNEQMTIEDTYVTLISMTDQQREPFIGKKVGDKMQVDINQIYPKAEQRAAVLGLKPEELEGVEPLFELEIKKIRTFVEPKIDAEFFTQAFPEGDVKTKPEFEAMIKQKVEQELDGQTNFKFDDNVRQYLVNKANLSLPEAFLKNWLWGVNEGKFTMEEVEKEFPQFLEMMRWDLIKRQIATDHKIEVTPQDATEQAKEMAMMQFRYYGMNTVADDMLENYAKQILANKEEAKKIYDQVGQKKVIAAIVEQITIKDKTMTMDEFSAMLQNNI